MPKVKSPFSLEHKWSVNWTRIPSSIRIDPRVMTHTNREEKALRSLASVGLISRKQLIEVFGLSVGLIKSMEKTHKLIPHTFIRNKEKGIRVYTLGIKGAMAIGLDNYEKNYWVRYLREDILKRLIFFQAYQHVSNLEILPTPSPFIGAIQNNDTLIYVYVMKGNPSDLMRYLRWERKEHHRLILVVEHLNELKALELYLENLRVRILLERDLISSRHSNASKENVFYRYEDGRLIR